MKSLAFVVFMAGLAICNGYAVTDLMTDTLKTSFLQSGTVVLYTYNTMCDSCRLQKRYFSEAVANQVYDSDPLFMNNDCSNNPRICRYYKIEKMPTVLIVKKDKTQYRYTGDLSSEEFLQFLSKNLNQKTGLAVISSLHIRIILLAVILIGLVCLFMKSTKSPERKEDIEEHAPLVDPTNN